MLDAQRCSLIRQKLTLARQLMRLASETWTSNSSLTNEALVQGGVTLIDEARRLMLGLIAHTFQESGFEGHSLGDLIAKLGEGNPEAELLRGLARESGSWWQRLDALVEYQQNPRPTKPYGESDGLIAVASSADPERSVEALDRLIDEFRAYLESFTERYEQW